MNLSNLAETLNLETLQPGATEAELDSAYTSDLLSDVMANAGPDSVLITIQAHKNTVAVAVLVGIKAIVLCNNRPVPQDMLEAAKQEEVAVFRTAGNQFVTSGRLYGLLTRDAAPSEL